MLTYAQSTLRLWAGHSTIAQHFYPPIATALEKTPFGFKWGDVYKHCHDVLKVFALIAFLQKKLGGMCRVVSFGFKWGWIASASASGWRVCGAFGFKWGDCV